MIDSYPKLYLYKRIVQAKLFIDNNFSTAIDLNNIADEAYFSKFHFIRLFKAIYSKTPHQYLTQVRIDHAKLFLQKGLSVTDTCYSVGFDSVSSFTALFRHHIRVSPSVFQQQHKERAEQIAKDPLQFVPACFAANNGWV